MTPKEERARADALAALRKILESDDPGEVLTAASMIINATNGVR